MNILNKLVLTEITFEDYVRINWNKSNLIGVSFLLNDNSVLDFSIEDGIEGFYYENEEDFLEEMYYEEDLFIWDDITIAGFPEVVKIHEWEW